MPGSLASLAGSQAAAETPRWPGRTPATCRGRAAATEAEDLSGGRAGEGPNPSDRCRRACAWSRSRKTSRSFLRSARMLRARARISLCACLVLRRRLPYGHESGPRTRTQVVAAQGPSGPHQTLPRISGRTRQTSLGTCPCRRLRSRTCFGPAPALAVCGRTFWVGKRSRAKLQGFP